MRVLQSGVDEISRIHQRRMFLSSNDFHYTLFPNYHQTQSTRLGGSSRKESKPRRRSTELSIQSYGELQRKYFDRDSQRQS